MAEESGCSNDADTEDPPLVSAGVEVDSAVFIIYAMSPSVVRAVSSTKRWVCGDRQVQQADPFPSDTENSLDNDFGFCAFFGLLFESKHNLNVSYVA